MNNELNAMLVGALLLIPTCFGRAEEPAPTSTVEVPPATADSADDQALVERGNQMLAQERYDKAIEAFREAHDRAPSPQTHVGLALAMLRGRQVLQPGDLCDPASFRAELEAHRDELDATCGRFRITCHSAADPIKDRHYEINSAIYLLDLATKLEPGNIAIYEKLTHAKIALLQFDEEAACRPTMADIQYDTESGFCRITRMDKFELPSLRLWSGETYTATCDN